jgi:hypothetical protein
VPGAPKAPESTISDTLAGEQGRVLGQLGEISKDAAAAAGYTGSRAIRDMKLSDVKELMKKLGESMKGEKDPDKRKIIENAIDLLRRAKKVVERAAEKAKKLKDEGKQTQQ